MRDESFQKRMIITAKVLITCGDSNENIIFFRKSKCLRHFLYGHIYCNIRIAIIYSYT